jgi:hypothetical protein
MSAAFAMQFFLKQTTCCVCHVAFAFDHNLYDRRRADRESFYCPNGHSQHFTGETDSAKLKRLLDGEVARRESAERMIEHERRSKSVYRGKLNALKGRVKNGVCPCCKRSFAQLARHMATQHPQYGAESVE